MKKFLSNLIIDLFSAWIIVLAGSLAIKDNNSFLIRLLLWLIVFVVLDLHLYLKNYFK